MAKVPSFAKAFAGRWRIVEMDNWAATSSILSKRRISPSRVSLRVKLPSVRRRAFLTSATARETVRPARSSHGKGTTRMTPPAVANGL